MEKMQKIGVTAFIQHDNKVLIVRRSQNESFLPGYYEMPGGKVEFGETAEDALIREIKEELNLKIKPMQPFSVFSYTSSNSTKHTIDIQFKAELDDDVNNIKLSKEHDDYKLVSEDELNEYKISALMKEVIKKGFNS